MSCTISTEEILPGERAEYWQAMMRERFGLVTRIEPLGEGEFCQQSSSHCLGPVSVSERIGSPFQATREENGNPLAFAIITQQGHIEIKRPRGSPTLIHPHAISVLPLSEAGQVRFLDPTRHVLMAFPAGLLSVACPDWESLTGVALDGSKGPVAMLFDLVRSLLEKPDIFSARSREAAAQLLLGLLGSALAVQEEGEASQSTRMRAYHRQRIRQYILNNLCNPQLDANAIAHGVGLSLRYIHNLFDGEPLHLMQWVQEQRLSRCYADLTSANHGMLLSVAEIAFSRGFNDAAHFSRTFKNRFGISPRALRDQAIRKKNS